MNIAQQRAKVAADKKNHPEHFCRFPGCLWKTAKINPKTGKREGGGNCPRHKNPTRISAMQWFRNGCQF